MTKLAGIDVSRWQAVGGYPGGLAFGIAKATEGAEHDRNYAGHYAAFRKRGLVVGAYCFGVGGAEVPVIRQADRFLEVADNADLLFLDLEINRNGPTMTNAEADAFVRHVQTQGRRIGLYHSASGFPSPKAVHFNFRWVADYRRAANLIGRPLILARWTFWQYTSTGGPGGSPLDRDWFNGDAAALAALVTASHV